jgi:tetratricopeptide (TPR) repeat protein
MMVIRDLAAGNWGPPIAGAEEAVANWRRTGDRFQLADALVWLAVVYARAGQPAQARSAVLEALQLFRAVDSPTGILSVLLGLAYLARWEDRYEDALRLVGTAESLREQVGGRAPLEFLAGFLGDPEAEARAHLSQEAAQWAFQQGRTMSVDMALALAVGQDATAG